MNTRRIHSRLLLALLLLVAGLAGAMRPQRVAAQSQPIPGSSLSWEYIPGTKTLSITGSGNMPDFAIFMNQPWGAFREQIETVTIGAGVTSVGKNAFLGCTALTAVTLPSSVTTIGAFAFVSCKALTGITIPSGVKTIKESVFFGCTALTSVTLPEGLQMIGASAFLGCSLTNVTLPNSLTAMGEAAFSSCTALTNVTLSDKLTTIEERAFKGCSQLKNVTIPNSVTTIGNGAFAQCSALKNVNVFWDTPLTISADAFSGINELDKVKLYVPAGKKGAYQAANVWKGFDVQEIPGGTLSTGLHWQYIPSTKTLTITGTGNMPDFNFPINQPWGAFRGQIENVTIGAGVKSVGENAFASCKKLTAVTLPSSVTTIGVYAFSNCKALTGITIPSGVKTIKESAFYGCTALTSVTLPEGLTTIEGGVFTNCDALASIELPASLQTIDASALDAPGLTEIKVQTGNTHFEAAEGVLYNKGKTALLRYPRKKPGTTFTVPASVTTIKEYAFTNCTALTGVTIPKDVTTIGECAFQGCTALTSVTLPADAKLTTIEQGAFYACEMLTSITLPEGLQTIGGNVFNTCEKLPSITIPKSVTTIGDGAFAYCSALKDVTVLRNTPLTIPPGVFAGITPPTGVTLHVPGGTGEAYQGDAVWGKLTIEELPWGDFDNGLHWAYDAATRTLTITNPTPGSPKPISDFTIANRPPWEKATNPIEKVKIEAGVTSVGAYAFWNCAVLTSVTLPEGLTTIGKYAFSYCTALTNVKMPNSVTTMGEQAFNNCSALTSVTLSDKLTTIEKYAFEACIALPSVTIPSGVTTIEADAFNACIGLTSVTLPAGLQTLGEAAFKGCDALTSIELPKSLETIGESALNAPGLTEIKVQTGNTHFEAEDGVLYNKGKTTLLCYPRKKPGTTFAVPASVTTIEAYAFSVCPGLTSIELPKSLTTLKTGAFYYCSALKDVTVAWPDAASIPDIQSNVFNYLYLGDIKLHVPGGTVDTYKAKNVWKDFDIQETPPTLSAALTDAAPMASAAGSTKQIKVQGNKKWKATIPAAAQTWLEFAGGDGITIVSESPDTTLTVKAKNANGITTARTATLDFVFEDGSGPATPVTVAVTQVATPAPTPRPRKPRPGPVPTPQLPDRPSAGTKIGGLTLSATNFTLNGERTFRFTITITPAHAADKRLSVSSSDETVVRVRILPAEETRRGLRAAPDPVVVTIEGTVCGLGKAKIHVKSTDGSNLTATCHVDVRALPTANIEAPATRLYTAAGHLHLTLPTATAVNVYNLTGTLVRTFIAPAGTSSIALSQGVYVVRAGTHTEKVFVD